MFVDLTGEALHISADGLTDTGNNGATCLNVNAARPNLDMTTTSGVRVTGFVPKFQSGGKYTVFVTQNQSGAFQFVTASSAYTPSPGSQGIRLFNGVSGRYDIYVDDTDQPLTALTPVLRNVGPATASPYVEARGGPLFLKGASAGGKTLALYWTPRPFVAGTNITLWVAQISGNTLSSVVEDCTVSSPIPA